MVGLSRFKFSMFKKGCIFEKYGYLKTKYDKKKCHSMSTPSLLHVDNSPKQNNGITDI